MNKKDTNKDYLEYQKTQINRSGKKWFSNSFNPLELEKILDDVSEFIKDSKTICCMGIRGGSCNLGNDFDVIQKRKEFKDIAIVYGVDINPSVETVPGKTYCVDFNELPDRWQDRFDLIYSNSIDHSYDINKTITEWYRVSQNNGYLLLTMSNSPKIGYADIYQFEEQDVENLFDNNRFEIIKVWRVEGQVYFNVLVKVKK